MATPAAVRPSTLLRALAYSALLAAHCSVQACMPWNEDAIEKAYAAKNWNEVVRLTAHDLENLPAAVFEPVREHCRWAFSRQYAALDFLSRTLESYDSRRHELRMMKAWYGAQNVGYLNAVNGFLNWLRPLAYAAVPQRQPDYMQLAQEQVAATQRLQPGTRMNHKAKYYLGTLYFSHGEFQKAEQLFREVQAAESAAARLNKEEERDLYVMFALTYNRLSRNMDAAHVSEMQLRALEKRGLDESTDYLEALISVASYAHGTGRNTEAVNYTSRSLQLARKYAESRPDLYRRAMTAHIASLGLVGRHTEAAIYQSQLVKTVEPGDLARMDIAQFQQQIFELRNSGRHAHAESITQERLQAARQNKAKYDLGTMLEWIATGFVISPDLGKRLAAAQELIQLYREDQSRDGRQRLANAYYALALVLKDKGEWRDALAALDQSVAIQPPSQTPDHLWDGYLRSRLLLGLGRTQEGLTLGLAAAKSQRKYAGMLAAATIRTYSELAASYAANRDFSTALELSLEAVKAVDSLYEENLFSETSSLRYMLAEYGPIYKRHAILLSQAGRHVDAFLLNERIKGRAAIMLTAQAIGAKDGALTGSERANLDRLRARITAADAEIAQNRGRSKLEVLEQRTMLARELKALSDQIAARYPQLQSLSNATALRSSDLRTLDQETRFVSIWRIDTVHYGAYVVDGNGKVTHHAIGPVSSLQLTTEAFTALPRALGGEVMVDGSGKPMAVVKLAATAAPVWTLAADAAGCQINPAAPAHCPSSIAVGRQRERQLEELGAFLGDAFIAPIWSRISTAKRIIISTDTSLATIPWDLVRYQGQYMASKFAISQAPNFWTTQEIDRRMTERRNADMRKPLFAFGNADYGQQRAADSSCVAAVRPPRQIVLRSPPLQAGDKLLNLAWSHCELQGVASLFQSDQQSVFERSAASEATLKRLSETGRLKDYRMLLFSGHGQFNLDTPLMSGLMFQGSGMSAADDGMVTLGDWAALRLNSDLVVLSGCETGRGEVLDGEGALGLPNALFGAGNTNTIASLWKVDDEGSAAFVLELFGNIKAGKPSAQALWETKNRFRAHSNPAYRTPAVWAAFALFGM